jgi:hypothetical protein
MDKVTPFKENIWSTQSSLFHPVWIAAFQFAVSLVVVTETAQHPILVRAPQTGQGRLAALLSVLPHVERTEFAMEDWILQRASVTVDSQMHLHAIKLPQAVLVRKSLFLYLCLLFSLSLLVPYVEYLSRQVLPSAVAHLRERVTLQRSHAHAQVNGQALHAISPCAMAQVQIFVEDTECVTLQQLLISAIVMLAGVEQTAM